ncbi:mannose-1-phosphate guanylyltransferase [Patescibacteria group bacterium]|nr:mannose-1-phosphate guanylyltransferase [Patescibacteria group bacterium]
MNVVILAGGGGTRLWPVSRKNKPKQIQHFIGDQTLMQETFSRIRTGFPAKNIYVSTHYDHLQGIRQQIPQLPAKNYILETAKKDTAGAIGLAAVTLAKKNPHEIMVMANADHYIKNRKEYIRLLKLAAKVIKKDPHNSVVIGIKPTYPETGYGYIKINKLFGQFGDDEVFFGQRFVEKPDKKTAQRYVKRWDYLWNSAIFCWRVDYLLELYQKHLPKHYAVLMRIQPALGTKHEKKVVTREFKKLKPISIDYGIMEKTKNILVIPASFDWVDVGHWRTVKEVLSRSDTENVVKGQHVGIESSGNLIYSYTGRLIGTAGLKDMIIIDTEDCLLVCPKDRAQDVKKIVEKLQKEKLNKYL